MFQDIHKFKEFIYIYIFYMEQMILSEKFRNNDTLFICHLKTVERSLSFFLDNFPYNQITSMLGLEAWHEIKIRRDRISLSISSAIEQNDEIKSRYSYYCESMKDPRRLNSKL